MQEVLSLILVPSIFAVCVFALQWKAGAPWCNPQCLVCSPRLLRWKVELGVDLLLRESLAPESGAGQRHREDILKFFFPSLMCSTSLPSPCTRKQLSSVIRFCTYFHHFIPLILFVCFFSLSLLPSIMTKTLVSSCHCAANHGSISSRCKDSERERRRKSLSGA